MGELIRGALALALERQRERYNALFAHARRATPSLDPNRFAELLRTVVAPIVERVAELHPERGQVVADALYETGLAVSARDLQTRFPPVIEGWRRLFGELPGHLGADPHGFAGAVTNALYNLSSTPGARPLEWIESVLELNEVAEDMRALLEAGKVAAWRAGMAHYRQSALSACTRLDSRLAIAALGLPANAPDLIRVIEALQRDPWLDPAKMEGANAFPSRSERRLRVVHRTGGFRGFGGVFMRPPRAVCADEEFFLSDGEAVWMLHADIFGATLHRAAMDQLPSGRSHPAHAMMDGIGRLTFNGASETIPELKDAGAMAGGSHTLIAVFPHSHDVRIVGLA